MQQYGEEVQEQSNGRNSENDVVQRDALMNYGREYYACTHAYMQCSRQVDLSLAWCFDAIDRHLDRELICCIHKVVHMRLINEVSVPHMITWKDTRCFRCKLLVRPHLKRGIFFFQISDLVSEKIKQ